MRLYQVCTGRCTPTTYIVDSRYTQHCSGMYKNTNRFLFVQEPFVHMYPLFLFVGGKFHITAYHECSGTDGQGRAIFKHNGSLFTADTNAINGRQCTA